MSVDESWHHRAHAAQSRSRATIAVLDTPRGWLAVGSMNSEVESAISDGFVRLSLPQSGFIDANGPLYGKWELDRIVLGIRIERRHCNTSGTCHGGMLALLADMLLAMGSNLQADLSRFLPTVNLTCDFLGPALLGSWIEGRLEVLRVTNSLVFSQGLLSVQGDPILRANAVLKIVSERDPRYAAEHFLPRRKAV